MAIFSWARPTPLEISRRIDPDQRIYLVSDLHLGDGTRSDSFLGKDRELMDLIDRVRAEGAHLVIAGDAIDFHQAWSMSRVLKAHAKLMGELARLAEQHGVTYIWGNHDYDISLFKDLLRFEVCSSLHIGDKVLVLHGYQFDPFIGPNLDQSHLATRIHHLYERVFNTWIRLPLENFYTLSNRMTFWAFHKLARVIEYRARLAERLGQPEAAARARQGTYYWIQNQLGDPGCMFEGARRFVQDHDYDYVISGHSHLPGRVPISPGKTYVNTGSWTYDSAQYALWDGETVTVHDWITKRAYDARAYQQLLDRRNRHLDVLAWWRENYLGWLRFRGGEDRRQPPPGA